MSAKPSRFGRQRHTEAMVCLLLCLTLSTVTTATTVYRWVDDNGTVSYHDKPPPQGQSQVEEKTIDPNKNIMQPYKAPAAPRARQTGTEPDTAGQTAGKPATNNKAAEAAISEAEVGATSPGPLAPTSTPNVSATPSGSGAPA